MSDTSQPQSTISELLERDPLQLSDQDLDQIIAFLRADRGAYLAGAKTAKKSSSDKPKIQSDLDLGELGL